MDTAAKRQSALTFGLPFLRGLIPDGEIAQADRQNASFSYGGILADLPVDDVIIDTINLVLFISRADSFIGHIDRSLGMKLYIEQSTSISVEG